MNFLSNDNLYYIILSLCILVGELNVNSKLYFLMRFVLLAAHGTPIDTI